MSVQPVTPRVTAISGHIQFYRDLDHHDSANDERVTGDIFDPEWPDKPLRLNPHRASNTRPTRGVHPASSADPMNAPAAVEGGRDIRPAGATSFPSVGARGGAGEQAASLGGGPASSTTGPCAGSEPSPPCGVRAGTGTISPDRGKHTPGSDLAACEVALSGAPETLTTTHSGASTSSDERGARRSPGAS